MPQPEPLPVDALRWRCADDCFDFETTASLEPPDEMVGQERAHDALRLGLSLYAPGYNVFVSGLTGTGKTTTVKRMLEVVQPSCRPADDRAYVHRFDDPDRPRLLTLPRGTARRFQEEVEELVDALKSTLPGLFEEEDFQHRRRQVMERYEEREEEVFAELKDKAEEKGLALVTVQAGNMVRPDLVPSHDGKPLPPAELNEKVESGEIDDEQVEAWEAAYKELQPLMTVAVRKARGLAREMEEELRDLARTSAEAVVRGPVEEIQGRWPQEGVRDWLGNLADDVLEHLPRFAGTRSRKDDDDSGGPGGFLQRYRVNVLLDHGDQDPCPVVVEQNPNLVNLFGTIERRLESRGEVRTDHMSIKAGSLLEADGGYLVIQVRDLLQEPGAWHTLKRVLRFRRLAIQGPESILGMGIGPVSLKPDPIPIEVKVVLIGDRGLYHLLYQADADFLRTFKVLAEFDDEMDRDDEALGHFMRVIARSCREEELLHLEPSGAAALAEHAVRRAGNRGRISLRFGEVVDVVREADWWARQDGAGAINREHLRQSVDVRRRRHSLIEEKVLEQIADEVVMIDVDGERVGVVNALSVLQVGDHVFGRPSRVTASVSVGRGGIVNVEREARLSGPTHTKGVSILTGFLRERYAADRPLALHASLAFEQSYGKIDGDSASSTEIYALFSALSLKPIRQDIAVTGSVNQKGEVQAIGGVNHKIEGFFDVCEDKGLTGTQGVMIPQANVEDLMLRDEVVQAVEAGNFHIWPVRTVDEGIELLTGVPAGEQHADGTWPEGTINRLVEGRLQQMSESLREWGPAFGA